MSRERWNASAVRKITARPRAADGTDGAAPAAAREALLATLFRDAPDAILVIDAASGRIVEGNRAVRHHLGYEPHWLIGRPLDALSPRVRWRAAVAERVRLHGALLEDQELRRIDGSRCVMQVRAWVAHWHGEAVIIVVLRDVRERERAEAGRRRAEERYRNATASLAGWPIAYFSCPCPCPP